MPVNNILDLTSLNLRLQKRGQAAEDAAVLAINKAATFSVKESIEEIASIVQLKKSYINRHISIPFRARKGSLRAIIQTNERATLLSRFPFQKSSKGVRASVNVGAGMRLLPKSFVLPNLKGSGATGIGFRNVDALAFYESKGFGSSILGGRKLSKLRNKAANKPRGIEIEHRRSINQLFDSVRVNIQPRLQSLLRREFINDYERLSI